MFRGGVLGFFLVGGLGATLQVVQASPIKTVDLASETAWTLQVDGGPSRSIKVPGGGWNSDKQEPQINSVDVRDNVVYRRRITVPEDAGNHVVLLAFGGCNYGAEVYLNKQKVMEHTGPMTPFKANITPFVVPGQAYDLEVKAFHRFHYGEVPNVPVPFDFNKGIVERFGGNTKFAYGLTGCYFR